MTDMNPSPAPSGASAAAEKPAVAGRLLGAADIRHIAAEAGISPTKKFGQNFVIDPGTVRRIVREAAVTADTRVLEVGPGLGSLTLAILETGATMTAVEIDPPVAQRLPHTIDTYMPDARNRLTVINKDALDTIYCAIGVNDVVTATAKTPGSGFSLELSGEHLGDLTSSGSDMRRNHAVLALFAIARAAGREPDVALHVDKHIPVGAGLGGGSADAAATLLAVNTLWGLHWPIERLRDIAATLGADMPFCLEGGYAHGTGFGERIIPLEDDSSCVQTLRDRGFAGQLLVGAYRAQLSTPNVYSTFDKMGAGDGDDNHLQRAAVTLHPRSGEAIEAALAAGASRSFVSGSGPSVIAFVTDDAVARRVRTAWEQSATVDRIIAAQAPARPVITVLPSLSYRVRQ